MAVMLQATSTPITLYRLAYIFAGLASHEFVYSADLVDRLEALSSFGVDVAIRAEE